MAYRWARHRVYDTGGKDKRGMAAISLLAVARAAAEETLQGSPMAGAWLKLFRTQISEDDNYWLRWRSDLAESAELRRAYSGLYGRFFARSLLTSHLGLSRFLSLKRNGIEILGSIRVERNAKGDIPDWIAWDDRNTRFVLCEAKGSLSATDFLKPGAPSCVSEGKAQFERVTSYVGGRQIYPAQWVAASRWATDQRKGGPVTILWDPPTEGDSFPKEDVEHHRAAMGRAWLESIAPGLGWSSADALLSSERRREVLLVEVKPGAVAPHLNWPASEDIFDTVQPFSEEIRARLSPQGPMVQLRQSITERDNLTESDLYGDRSLLDQSPHEEGGHEGEYLVSLITRFGIRPIRTRADFEMLQNAQERAYRLEEPAMIVGLPIGFDPSQPDNVIWRDEAGIASKGGLSIFDLRMTSVNRI